MPAAHDLDEVRQLIHEEARPAFGRGGAIDVVRALLDLDVPGAQAFIRARVLALRPENYAHTLTNQPPPADVYGVEFAGHAWYLKVTILAVSGRRLLVISCHPPTAPLRTLAGIVKR